VKVVFPSIVIAVFAASCGHSNSSSIRYRHPAVATARAEAKKPGVVVPEGVMEPGDTVDLAEPLFLIDGEVLVRLPNGKRGFVPKAALALPDSVLRKLY